jgi:tetratricopeptide (TPR) repeat protein
MKHFAVALLGAGLALGAAPPVHATHAMSQAAPQASITINDPKERDAFLAIKSAATPAAALAAAKAALTQYPNSVGKPAAEADLYNILLDAITATPGAVGSAEIAQMAKDYAVLFPGTELSLKLRRSMINYYLAQKDYAEVFAAGEAYLGKFPNHAPTHVLLLETAVTAVSNNVTTHVAKGYEHGRKGLTLLEAGTKPVDMADADWTAYRSSKEHSTNQLLGLVALQTGDRSSGTRYLEKAIALNPKEPLSYFYLAVSREMQGDEIAKKYNALLDKGSAEGKKLLEDAKANEDAIIDLLVKSVAAAGTQPQFANLVAQARPSLEAHYKNRHNGSLTGLDEKLKAAGMQ